MELQVLDVAEESSEDTLQSLRQSGLFEFVERDHYARLAVNGDSIPNDPSYAGQWHLPRIGAPRAWNFTTGAASVVIAIIDSGVDATHPDLAPKVVPGWNFLTNGNDTTDQVGHGTAVAGTAAAASNNGIGVAGVSWHSRIMPLVVVDSNEFASYSNIAAAIQYAADNGARVINISIGGSSPSDTLQAAVNYAWTRNAVVFASAMNDSSTAPSYPAACTHAIAVSATDSNDLLADFSNYGNWIAVAAPGVNILTTSMGGGYGYWSGTSFSAPIAAGAAALALAFDPSLTAADLVALIEQNTDDLGTPGFDRFFGWGRINVSKMVAAEAQRQPLAVTAAPVAVNLSAGQKQQFTATVAGTTASAVTWSISPAVGSIAAGGLYTAPASIGVTQTVTITATVAGGPAATSTVTLVPPPVRKSDPGPARVRR